MTEETQNDAPVSTDPLFISITGKTELIALTSGHTASVGPDPKGTPLHARFHRAAMMRGVVPLQMQHSVAAEQVPATGKTKEQRLIEAITDMIAIGATDPDAAKALFTNDGIPDIRALSSRVGFKVTATDRDAAWLAFNGGKE